MFPVLWRYLLHSYLKVFALCVCTFVSVLIVSRFKEIARFAALSGDWIKTCLFVLYQIPFILPLAIPISALVSSFLLFQRLSRSYELSALRASGLSFPTLLSPLLFASMALATFNFSICADISPYCWRESKALLYRETSANPLLLMQRQDLVKIKQAYLKMDVKKERREASDFILIAHNASNQRLNLVSARKLRLAGEKLLGYDVALITQLPARQGLLIENQAEMSTAAPVFSAALKKNRPKLEPNALSLRMLRLRMQETGKQATRAKIEILRRVSLSLAVFTFTMLGCAFGIEQTRSHSKKGLAIVFLLSVSVLMAYLGLKALKIHPLLAVFTAFIPHAIVVCVSTLRFAIASKGKIY